jgi:hypothetical protein
MPLVQKDVQFARAELASNLNAVVWKVGSIIIAAIFALVALLALAEAAIFALVSQGMPRAFGMPRGRRRSGRNCDHRIRRKPQPRVRFTVAHAYATALSDRAGAISEQATGYVASIGPGERLGT